MVFQGFGNTGRQPATTGFGVSDALPSSYYG